MAAKSIEKPLGWEEEAVDVQQRMLSVFGEFEWDSYKDSELEFLERKVGFALFGPPNELPSLVEEESMDELVNVPQGALVKLQSGNKIGYSALQYKVINEVCSAIIEQNRRRSNDDAEILMSMIFVCLNVSEYGEQASSVLPVAVFKVPNDLTGVYFIDSSTRVYKNWNDFLNNNELPQCKYCFPYEGAYQKDENGNVLVQFGKTPACKARKKVITALDITNAGVCVGSAAVTALSVLFPVTGAVVAASLWGGITAGTYGFFRSSSTLVDRAKHNQSVALTNSEARNCWLSMAGSVFGAASLGASSVVAKMTRAGHIVGKAGLMTSILSFGSLTVNGLNVINGAWLLQDKYNRDELTKLDVFQFTAAVLFFTHSAINFETANSIIRDPHCENQKYQTKSKRSNRVGKSRIAKGVNLIRHLRRIKNEYDFHSNVMQTELFFPKRRSSSSSLKCTETVVEVDGTLSMNLPHTSQSFNHTPTGKASDELDKPISGVSNDRIIRYQLSDQLSTLSDIVQFSESRANLDVQKLRSVKMDDIFGILTNNDKHLCLRIIEASSVFFGQLARLTNNWYFQTLDFLCKELWKLASEIDHKYKNDLQAAKKKAGYCFDQEEFDEEYNLLGKLFDKVYSIIEEKLLDPDKISALKMILFKTNDRFLCEN